MITLFPTNFPAQPIPLINKDGTMTIPGTNFWKALWNRTGGGTGIFQQNTSALVATGTAQADALSLMADWNQITTTASGTGVVLPSLTGGQSCLVLNSGATSLNVYPPTDAQIDVLGANNPYSLATLKMQIYWFFSSTAIYSTQLG